VPAPAAALEAVLTGCPSQAVTVATSATRHQSAGGCAGRQASECFSYHAGVKAADSSSDVALPATVGCPPATGRGAGMSSGAIVPGFAADATAGVGVALGAGEAGDTAGAGARTGARAAVGADAAAGGTAIRRRGREPGSTTTGAGPGVGGTTTCVPGGATTTTPRRASRRTGTPKASPGAATLAAATSSNAIRRHGHRAVTERLPSFYCRPKQARSFEIHERIPRAITA
jgi:hypothetical protein